MDDLKVQQTLGEGGLKALVAEAEAQGWVAGAAAEAERIWGLGKVLVREWDGGGNRCASFLAELRKRAVPGEAAGGMSADELVQASQAYFRADPPAMLGGPKDPYRSDAENLAKLKAYQEQQAAVARSARGGIDLPPYLTGLVDSSGAVLPDSISAREQGAPGVHLPSE